MDEIDLFLSYGVWVQFYRIFINRSFYLIVFEYLIIFKLWRLIDIDRIAEVEIWWPLFFENHIRLAINGIENKFDSLRLHSLFGDLVISDLVIEF